MSLRRSDAASGEAVQLRDATGRLCEDRSHPPSVVPLSLLDCQVELREFACSQWSCRSEDVFELVRLEPTVHRCARSS